jgi:hypothetical protein
MADDNQVEIQFSATTDDALDAISQLGEGLAKLGAPAKQLNGVLAELKTAFSAATPVKMLEDANTAFDALQNDAARTALQMRNIGAEIALLHQGLAQQKTVLAAEANQYQITQNQKFAMLEEATQNEYEAELKLLEKEAALGNLSVKQWDGILLKKAELKEKHDSDMLRLDEQAIAQQQQMWNSALSSIENAFNSQLRGLLAGTTSWSTAFKKILGDLIIQFIEMCESMVVKWTAAQLAQTTAATTGAAARAAAEQSASNAGVLGMAASAVKAIMTDAGQAFAGVFAFLAPTMGPAAAGPAAAAQASVSAAAIFDLGTDYVVRGGLAVIHPGETIIPPARGSGPFSGAGLGAQVHAPVSINVSALDAQSVKRFFDDNSSHMMRAINDAVKRGAHLGLRGARP